jgi:uncharacterized protein (DUF433 family)
MASTAKWVYPHITKHPQICSGRPCVDGTRIRVMDIVAMRREGLTPEQIVAEFSSLSGVEDVYAALLYYHDHLDEIDNDFVEDKRLADDWERDHEPQPPARG